MGTIKRKTAQNGGLIQLPFVLVAIVLHVDPRTNNGNTKRKPFGLPAASTLANAWRPGWLSLFFLHQDSVGFNTQCGFLLIPKNLGFEAQQLKTQVFFPGFWVFAEGFCWLIIFHSFFCLHSPPFRTLCTWRRASSCPEMHPTSVRKNDKTIIKWPKSPEIYPKKKSDIEITNKKSCTDSRFSYHHFWIEAKLFLFRSPPRARRPRTLVLPRGMHREFSLEVGLFSLILRRGQVGHIFLNLQSDRIHLRRRFSRSTRMSRRQRRKSAQWAWKAYSLLWLKPFPFDQSALKHVAHNQ